MQLLSMDHGTAVSGRDSLEVQGSGSGGSSCSGSSTGQCPKHLPAQKHDEAGVQRRGRASDVQELRQAPVGQASQGDQRQEGQLLDRDQCRIRGVPEVLGVEESLPDKQVRKIRAALKQAIGFWRQIQAMLTGHGTGETEVSKIMRQRNAEICRELYFRPEGTKGSRQIAEAMV